MTKGEASLNKKKKSRNKQREIKKDGNEKWEKTYEFLASVSMWRLSCLENDKKSHDKQEQCQTMVWIEGTNRQKELLYKTKKNS
jgi:sulfur transfer protein SufE